MTASGHHGAPDVRPLFTDFTAIWAGPAATRTRPIWTSTRDGRQHRVVGAYLGVVTGEN